MGGATARSKNWDVFTSLEKKLQAQFQTVGTGEGFFAYHASRSSQVEREIDEQQHRDIKQGTTEPPH